MDQRGFVPIIYIFIFVLITGAAGSFLIVKNNGAVIEKNSSPAVSLSTSELKPTSTSTSTPSPSAILSFSAKASPTPIASAANKNKPENQNSPGSATDGTIASTPTPTPTPAPRVLCTINSPVSNGWAPVYVNFSYSSSDQSRVTGREWDLNGDGTWDSETENPSFTFNDIKSYEVKLKLKLSDGSYSDICTKTITVNPPSVNCEVHANVSSGVAPLSVNFVYGAAINDRNDYVTDVQWDFNGDGNWDTPYDVSSQHPAPYIFQNPGTYTAKMHLKTKNGHESPVCTNQISVTQ